MISAGLMVTEFPGVPDAGTLSFQLAGNSGYRRPLFSKLFLLQEEVIRQDEKSQGY